MLIDITNTRRFIGPEGQVLAIYDFRRGFNLYGEVGADHLGRLIFASPVRSYFNDEVEEI